MTAPALLSLSWAALVLAGAARHRPPPARLRALLGPAAGPPAPLARPRPDLLAGLGRAVAEAVGRGPPDPRAARRLGVATAGALATVPLSPWAAPVTAVALWALPAVRARRAGRRRLEALGADLPEAVDLMALAVGAGLNVAQAVEAVARRLPGPLAAELGRAHLASRRGRRLADALDELPARLGEPVRPLVAALVASERYGASATAGLARLADEARRQHRRRAEEAARRAPVALLFPLVLCTLPAFALLTLAPLVAGALHTLRL